MYAACNLTRSSERILKWTILHSQNSDAINVPRYVQKHFARLFGYNSYRFEFGNESILCCWLITKIQQLISYRVLVICFTTCSRREGLVWPPSSEGNCFIHHGRNVPLSLVSTLSHFDLPICKREAVKAPTIWSLRPFLSVNVSWHDSDVCNLSPSLLYFTPFDVP